MVVYIDLLFMAGIKKDFPVALMPELDIYCYLGVNFVREFQAGIDPCWILLLIKKARWMVELELSSITGADSTAISALGLGDVTAMQKDQLQRFSTQR